MEELEHIQQLNSDGKVNYKYKTLDKIIPRVDKATGESYGIVTLLEKLDEYEISEVKNILETASVVKSNESQEEYIGLIYTDFSEDNIVAEFYGG